MTTIVAVRRGDLACIAADTLTKYGEALESADFVVNADKLVRVGDAWLGPTGPAAAQLVLSSYFGRPDVRGRTSGEQGLVGPVEVRLLPMVVTIDFDEYGFGLATSFDVMAMTSDNGDHWQRISPPEFGKFRHIEYHQDHFWVLIDKSVYRSSDNGSNWEWQISMDENLL